MGSRYCYLFNKNIYFHIFNSKLNLLNHNKYYYLNLNNNISLCYICNNKKGVFDKIGTGYSTHCDECNNNIKL
jgi:hypothetical protein